MSDKRAKPIQMWAWKSGGARLWLIRMVFPTRQSAHDWALDQWSPGGSSRGAGLRIIRKWGWRSVCVTVSDGE